MSIATEITRLQTAKNDLKAAIENKGVTVGDGTIDTYAEKVAEIESGGGDSYYDTFWDSFQDNGNRTTYDHAFRHGWNNDTFKPKHRICPISASYMFSNCTISGDLRELCTLDLSNNTSTTQMFYQAKNITAVGVLDLRRTGSNSSNMFNGCYALEFVELIMLTEGGTQSLDYAFSSARALKEIRFEGVIGRNIEFKSSPLSVASMKNIIEHLKDFNGTGSENTVKITFTDACWEALEADSTAPDGGTWKDYVQYTLCWNA